jgi:CRISPR-associated endonuclease/helicase Cas3
VHVCIPPLESGDNESKRVGVYAVSDLRDAVDWLGSLPDDEGITPWAVATHAPAPVLPSRLTFQRLEWADVENLSETGDDPAAEHRIGESGPAGVSLWIDDDLEPDVDVRVAVRRLSASGIDQFDTRLLSLTPVLDEETAPVPIRQLFARLHQPGGLGRAFLVRGEDDIIPLLGDLTVAPGDTILLDERAATFTDGVFDPAGESTLRDVYADAVDRRNRMASSEDVLPFWGVRSVCPRGGMDPDAGGDLARTDLIALATALRSATLDDDLADAHAGKSDPLSVLREWLLEHPAPKAAPSERRGTTLLSLRQIAEQRQLDEILDGRAVVDVVSSDDLDEEFTIVFTRAPRLGVARLETTTFRREPVLLRDHECDVARRAQELAEACGLSEFAGALESAGNLHDEGKRDPRFQRMLRYKDPGLLSLERASDEPRILAKSRSGSKTGEQAFRARLGLRGWRHEQLSAVIAWEKLNEEQPLERELVVRLAGTSHGHGRILFPDGSTSLLAGWDQTSEGDAYRESLKEGARHLFDDGGWDSLIERTGRRYGFWGVSYLEAVLRAADVQISELGGVLGGAGRQCRSRRGGVQHE